MTNMTARVEKVTNPPSSSVLSLYSMRPSYLSYARGSLLAPTRAVARGALSFAAPELGGAQAWRRQLAITRMLSPRAELLASIRRYAGAGSRLIRLRSGLERPPRRTLLPAQLAIGRFELLAQFQSVRPATMIAGVFGRGSAAVD